MKSIKNLVNKIVNSINKNKKTVSLITCVSFALIIGLISIGLHNKPNFNQSSQEITTDNDIEKESNTNSVTKQESQDKNVNENNTKLNDKDDKDLISDEDFQKLVESQNNDNITPNTNQKTEEPKQEIKPETDNAKDENDKSDDNYYIEDENKEEITLSEDKPTYSGFDSNKEKELFEILSNSSTNVMKNEVLVALDKIVNEECYGPEFNANRIKEKFLNYKLNDKNIIHNVEVDVVTLNENFTIDELYDQLAFDTIVNYLNVKAYYDVKNKTYTIYYIAAED